MSDYFDRFMRQSKFKVDMEDALRWKYSAMRNGDKDIKAQMATARRTATSLERSIQQFSNLRPEQELAIKAGASAVRALARDMETLCAWAKSFKAFFDIEYKKDRDTELETIAFKRWGADDEAFKFEFALMQELGSTDGKLNFGNWMLSMGLHLDATTEDIACAVDGVSYGESNGTDRHRAALTVQSAKEKRFQKWTGLRGVNVITTFLDYEKYLLFRRGVARTATETMQKIASTR